MKKLGFSLEELAVHCTKIIQDAGNLLMTYFARSFDVAFKGQFNMVTAADLASEDFICSALEKLTPGIALLSEEDAEKSGSDLTQTTDYQWIIDPLDGTTNFAHQLPHFCISVALVHCSDPLLGLVYDPVKKELFTAIRQKGTFLNGTRCYVSQQPTLETSILATGFPYRVRELTQNNLAEFCAIRLNCQGVRRMGAAALDLAYVSAGRLDGFWERWLKPWDTAAGILLVQEAGGLISRFDGSSYTIYDAEISASNGKIHPQLQKILTRHWPEIPKEFKITSQ